MGCIEFTEGSYAKWRRMLETHGIARHNQIWIRFFALFSALFFALVDEKSKRASSL
jgi:hypothetical protein